MKRWVLIRPCNQSPYYDPELQEPLGLEYLQAVLHRQGEPVLLLDSALHAYSDTRLARRAISFQPDVIGFSLTTAQEIDSVLAIYAECMKVLANDSAHTHVPQVHWLAGGNFISTEPLLAQKLLPPGFKLVRYEGEKVLDTVLLSGSAGESAGGINDGTAVQDLDSLPFPHRPFARQILDSDWAFNLQGSRGCCGVCQYCSSPGMSEPAAKRWRGRSPGHIAEEIQLLYKNLGALSFNFVDEDFLGPLHSCAERARNFAREIQKRKLKISFSIQVRPATLNKEIIHCLAQAGLNFVFMGIESDDPEDFKRWARPWCPDTWKIVELLKKYDIEVNAGVMLFHSHSTFPKLRRFGHTLKDYHLLNYRTATNRLDAMPGSVFYKKAVKRGEIEPDSPGPQPLPYIYPGIKAFHHDLLAVLSPLGPPSMQALCSSLPLLARRSLSPGKDTGSLLYKMKNLQHRLDQAVAQAFFLLLDFHEKGIGKSGIVSRLRKQNLEIALAESRNLAAEGFAPSFDMLREAIRLDSGL